MTRFIIGCLAIAGMLAVSADNANAIIIDTFDVTTQEVSDPPFFTLTPANSSSASEAIGGWRDISVSKTSGTGSVFLSANSSSIGAPGFLIYDEPSAGNGSFSVYWDGGDGDADSSTVDLDYTGLGGVDVTDGGANNILRFLAFSNTGIDLVFTFYTDADNYATGTVTVPGGTTIATPVDLTKHFNTFTVTDAVDATPFSFSNIGAITLVHSDDGANNTDVGIGLFVQTVPEPTSIALLGMGAFGLMGYGWRRKKKVVTE